MQKNIKSELHEIINQLSIPNLTQLFAFAKKVLEIQNRDFKKE